MMRLFTPRKTTLLFVIRDKTKVEVTALSSYEEKEELFMEQVAELRPRFMDSIAPGGLAGDRSAVVPGSGFPFSTQEIWKVIKENKDLDLPAHKVMVATVRCEEIASEKLNELAADKDWKSLEEDSRTGFVPGFGKKLSSILRQHLSGYDAEAAFFDEAVRNAKRQLFLNKSLEMLLPTYQVMIAHHRSKAFDKFREELELFPSSDDGEGFAARVRRCTDMCLSEFDRGCADCYVEFADWYSSKMRDKLARDIDAHATTLRAEKLTDVATGHAKQLEIALSEPVAALFDAAGRNTWPAIKKLLAQETQTATADLEEAISNFEPDLDEKQSMIANLQDVGKRIVQKKAREEAGQALLRMKERFISVFSHAPDSMPRVWTGKEDMKAIIRDARTSAIQLLSTLSAVNLEDKKSEHIETALSLLLHDASDPAHQGDTSTNRSSITTTGPSVLASSTWEGVAQADTLITPVQCRSLWRQFNRETDCAITQAIVAQEASKRGNSSLPPAWAIVAMVCLGFNEFMMLLRNPLYLLVGLVLFLVGRAVWVQLDIQREFQHGYLAGVISVSAKLLPTFMNFLKRLAEEGQQMANSSSFSSNSMDSSGNHSSKPHKDVTMQEMVSFADSRDDSSVTKRMDQAH